MEWTLPMVSALVVLVLLVPLGLALAGLVLLGAAGHLLPARPVVSRITFDCPFSRRRVTAELLTAPQADRPTDVLSCTAFPKPYHVRCKKECLALADAHPVSTLMLPRFSLIADGVAYRTSAGEAGEEGVATEPKGQMTHAV